MDNVGGFWEKEKQFCMIDRGAYFPIKVLHNRGVQPSTTKKNNSIKKFSLKFRIISNIPWFPQIFFSWWNHKLKNQSCSTNIWIHFVFDVTGQLNQWQQAGKLSGRSQAKHTRATCKTKPSLKLSDFSLYSLKNLILQKIGSCLSIL